MNRILVCVILIALCGCNGPPPKGTKEYGTYLYNRAKVLADELPNDPDINLFVALYDESYADAEKYFLRSVKNRDDAFTNLYVGAFYGHYLDLPQWQVTSNHAEQATLYLTRAAALDSRNAVPRTMLMMLQIPDVNFGGLERSSERSALVINFYAEAFTASMVRALQKLDMLDSYDVLFAAGANTPIDSWGDGINVVLNRILDCETATQLGWLARYEGIDSPDRVFPVLRIKLALRKAYASTRLSQESAKCGFIGKDKYEQERAVLKALRDESKPYLEQVKAGLFLNPPLPDQQNKEWEVAKRVMQMASTI